MATRICPLLAIGAVSYRIALPGVVNDAVDASTRCKGSTCMAWRTRTYHHVNRLMVGSGGKSVETSMEALPAGSGFCGLAGLP